MFPLPNLPARASIIDIHTRKWAQPPPAELQQELANKCVGYCGADLKVLRGLLAAASQALGQQELLSNVLRQVKGP